MYYKRLKRLTKRQCVMFAVFCAEQALPVFEKEYPSDPRVRAHINRAKKWLGNTGKTCYTVVRMGHIAEFAAVAASNTAYSRVDPATQANFAAFSAIEIADKTKIENYLLELEACTSND